MKKHLHLENIKALAEAGLSRIEIAKRIGLSRQRIDQLLQPEKHHARIMLCHHVKIGTIKRPERCSLCGAKCETEAHHCDYSRPLYVDWLCVPCHALQERSPRQSIQSAIVDASQNKKEECHLLFAKLSGMEIGSPPLIINGENLRNYAAQCSYRLKIKIKTRRCINSDNFEIYRVK